MMEIIGKAGDRDLIVKMTQDEIAQLHGESSGYSYKCEPGTCYPVSEMYTRAAETLQAYSDLRKALSNLKSHAEKLLGAMAQRVELVEEKKEKK